MEGSGGAASSSTAVAAGAGDDGIREVVQRSSDDLSAVSAFSQVHLEYMLLYVLLLSLILVTAYCCPLELAWLRPRGQYDPADRMAPGNGHTLDDSPHRGLGLHAGNDKRPVPTTYEQVVEPAASVHSRAASTAEGGDRGASRRQQFERQHRRQADSSQSTSLLLTSAAASDANIHGRGGRQEAAGTVGSLIRLV